MHFGQIFSTIWFILLFLAAITSSISLAQPAVSFLEDELDIDKKTAVLIFSSGTFILSHLSIFFLRYGVLDDLDFWAAEFCLVIFALIEVLLFGWVFGINRAWEEIHYGANLRIPAIYKFIIKFITPSILITILAFWFVKRWWDIIIMKDVTPENRPVVLASRLVLLMLFWGLAVMVKLAWRRKRHLPVEPIKT